MTRHRLTIGLAVVALAIMSACSAPSDREGRPSSGLDFQIAFEERLRPDIIFVTGTARRDPSPGAAAGLWGVLRGLPRAEQAVVENLGTGAKATISLYSGNPGGGATLRLSPQAADLLGVLEDPVEISVTAIRQEPVLVQ